ncbi:hypothetical protein EDB19DRAFT_1746105 [Suillus lakei]|nr:hypothetical protein EDB19DRAFT_1746105 [Suillus lakei]
MQSSEINNAVKAYSQDAQDTLMKYTFKGMGMTGWGNMSGSALLGWHEKVRLELISYKVKISLQSEIKPAVSMLFGVDHICWRS